MPVWYSCWNSRRASVWLMKSSNVRRENVSGKPAFPRLKFNTTQKEMSENKDRQNYFKPEAVAYRVVCVRLRNVITQLFSRETSVRKCQIGVYFCLSGVGDDYYAGVADVCAHSKKNLPSYFQPPLVFSPAVWWRSSSSLFHSFFLNGWPPYRENEKI